MIYIYIYKDRDFSIHCWPPNYCFFSHLDQFICLGMPNLPAVRMNRYMDQHKKAKIQASPELVKLWGTGPGRPMAACQCFGHVFFVWHTCL